VFLLAIEYPPGVSADSIYLKNGGVIHNCRKIAADPKVKEAGTLVFIRTPGGKGIVSEGHPRCLGHGGLAASMWARAYTAAGVDAAVALGTDLDDSSVGLTKYVGEHGRLVHVDRNPRVFARNLPTALAVVADLGSFADAMYDAVVDGGLRNGCISALVHDARARSAHDVPHFATDDAVPIAPHRAIADLQRAAGDDAVFVSDIGEHMLFALHYLTAHGPDRFHIQLGLGSMGSGIASAVGVALGHGGRRRVVCVCGDGGMQMLGMEALVAVEHRLPIVWAVFNDGRYNMVFHGHRFVYGREAPWASPPIDFTAWAASFGMASARIDEPGEISAARIDSLTIDGPALLDIRIDREIRIRGGGRNESLVHMSMAGASRA
jgi:acetolactate synthase-1/2/3 large subunit